MVKNDKTPQYEDREFISLGWSSDRYIWEGMYNSQLTVWEPHTLLHIWALTITLSPTFIHIHHSICGFRIGWTTNSSPIHHSSTDRKGNRNRNRKQKKQPNDDYNEQTKKNICIYSFETFFCSLSGKFKAFVSSVPFSFFFSAFAFLVIFHLVSLEIFCVFFLLLSFIFYSFVRSSDRRSAVWSRFY